MDETIAEKAVEETPRMATWRLTILSISIGLCLFVATHNTTNLAISLVLIGRDLDTLDGITWVALSYNLAYVCCTLIIVHIATILGNYPVYMASLFFFSIFSFASGYAQTLPQLVTLRALQGIGGAGIYALSPVLWDAIAPNHYRKSIAAACSGIVGMAAVAGPLVGFLLSQYLSWRFMFVIGGLLVLAAVNIFTWTWPGPMQMVGSGRSLWASLDLVGFVLFLVAAVCYTFGFDRLAASRGQATDANDMWLTWVPGTYYLILLYLKGRAIEKRGTRQLAAFPRALFRHPEFALSFVYSLFMGFAFFVLICTFPLRMQILHSTSAVFAGVLLLPMLGAVAVGSVIGGVSGIAFSSPARSHWYLLCCPVCFGGALIVTGVNLDIFAGFSTSLWVPALVGLPLIGLGWGLGTSATAVAATTNARRGNDGNDGNENNDNNDNVAYPVCQGVLAQVRVIGSCMGLALSGAVLAGVDVAKLAKTDPSVHTPLASVVSAFTPGDAVTVRQTFLDAYVNDLIMLSQIASHAIFYFLLRFSWYPPDLEYERTPGGRDTIQDGHAGERGDAGRTQTA
ncbi:major facilitator superfamily transporter [Niveomyces insectorum RCEF 264]|uniref:Major facilitator superfamily transporter n=1 Tax=Niveomyces insectorum RCEF 264 TaxID=1081102 RepID=A0A167PIS3_9HYPO|nr:major facilitator superfamily transporter [Niveomyces insectorum RCEF 264]